METYVSDANAIFAEYKSLLTVDTRFANLSPGEQLSYYQKKKPIFAKTFPITLRYMIELGTYNEKAFRKFIKKLQDHPYKSETEYCERQADYIKFLYIETNAGCTKKEAKSIWKCAKDILIEEVNTFKNAMETIKKKNGKNDALNDIEKREELKKELDSNV